MERARTRARQLRQFYGSLTTYVLVCALLVVIDLVGGSTGDTFIGLDWAYWPILGWGIFVLMHGISVAFPRTGWEERKVQELYEKERQRDLQHH
jgi:hypothetical protein